VITFSVIIPTYNSANTIRRALQSCTEESYLPLEIIVVDDASQDATLAVIEEFIVSYHGAVQILVVKQQENSGPARARNIGWDLAQAEYVAFLDADDTFMVEKLKKIVTILREHQDIILFGHQAMVRGANYVQTDRLSKVAVWEFLKRNLFTTPSVIVKRAIPERFDESMRYTEDHDLWLRISEKYDKSYYLDSVLTVIDRPVRSRGGQSSNLWAMREGEIKMYYKFCKTNSTFMVLFPLFLGYSLAKHFVKLLKGRS